MRGLLVPALVVVLCGVARADDPVDRPEAFEVDRESPPPGQAEFSFDGGGPIINDWAASVQLGYLVRPFNLRTSTVEVFPVRQRQTLALGGAVRIGERIVIDVRMPFAHQTGDRLMGLGDDKPLDNWVPGDLGFGIRGMLVEREGYAAFARGHATFGTGDDFDFAGEARFTLAWMLIGRITMIERLTIAATAGVRFRGAEVIVADRLLGDELFGALGASYQLPALPGLYCDANELRVIGELVGVLGNDVAGKRGPSPAEVRFGVANKLRDWLWIAARGGTAIDDQIGAPRFRAMVEVVYGARAF